MQEMVKRYFWIVIALAIAASALFAAKLVNNVAEAKLLPDAKHGPKIASAAPSPSAPVTARRKDGEPLIKRNIFCSECKPPEPTAPVAANPAAPGYVPMTSLPLLLVATHVTDDRHANESFATIINTATQKQGSYWMGGMIPGAGKVEAIHYKFVDFHNDATQRVERISITGEAPSPPPAVAVAPPTPKPTSKDDIAAAIEAGIKKVDDNNYEIDRSLVDKVLANPMAVAKGARIMPSAKNGEPNGFKLYAVRPSSVYAKLGFSNGDTIHAINGMELNSMDKAMEVYSKVREASNLQVNVTRRGKPVTLNYTIR